MQTLLIETKDAAEYSLIKALLEKMKIRMKILNLSDEEKEDLGLSLLMHEVDWNETVSRDVIWGNLFRKKAKILRGNYG
jgi:hypothetical protein